LYLPYIIKIYGTILCINLPTSFFNISKNQHIKHNLQSEFEIVSLRKPKKKVTGWVNIKLTSGIGLPLRLEWSIIQVSHAPKRSCTSDNQSSRFMIWINAKTSKTFFLTKKTSCDLETDSKMWRIIKDVALLVYCQQYLSMKLDIIYLPQAIATPYTRGTREQIRSSSLIHFGALSFWFLFLYIKWVAIRLYDYCIILSKWTFSLTWLDVLNGNRSIIQVY